MTRKTREGWLAALKLPFNLKDQVPPAEGYGSIIFPTAPINHLAREYQAASLFQAGAGAVLEWRTPLVEEGFVEVYEHIDMLMAAGGAGATVRLFIQMHGITGADQDLAVARFSLAAAHQIDFLGNSGDPRPEFGPGRSLTLPAGSHIFIDTTAAAAVGTDLTMTFLRYRTPGPPGINTIEDISDVLTT